MAELKPCPFCGGEADLIDMSDEYEGEYWVAHQCPSGASAETYSYETAAEAIAAWNTRAATTIGRVQVEVAQTVRTCRNVDDEFPYFKCSECECNAVVGYGSSGDGLPNYCPNCGAKVVE